MSDALVFLACMIDGLVLLVLSVYLREEGYGHAATTELSPRNNHCGEMRSMKSADLIGHIKLVTTRWLQRDQILVMLQLVSGLSALYIILLSDLECDFLNTKQGCKQLNKWVLPEIVATSFIPVLLLISWHWFLFLLSAPLAGYLIHRYVMLAPGSLGVYDATEIRNRGMLTNFTREAFIKIGYHLVMFFISLYCFIVALLVG